MASGAKSVGVSWNSCCGGRSSQLSKLMLGLFAYNLTVSGADSGRGGGRRGEGERGREGWAPAGDAYAKGWV